MSRILSGVCSCQKLWETSFAEAVWKKLVQKYDGWTEDKKRFERLFTLAIFLPVAPDDFLCYLAGTTTMSWERFATVILLGKPFAILLYSLLLNTVWNQILLWLK